MSELMPTILQHVLPSPLTKNRPNGLAFVPMLQVGLQQANTDISALQYRYCTFLDWTAKSALLHVLQYIKSSRKLFAYMTDMYLNC